MTGEDIIQSKEYIFAREACRYGIGKDVVQAFKDGAEYGYKFAVDKACDVLEVILEDFLHGGDSAKVVALLEEKMEE